MSEEWKNIEGYPNYSVSNLGRVRNDRSGKVLKPIKRGGYTENQKYLFVGLRCGSPAKLRSMSIHRLVAVAFIPNPENKPQVNHKDGNRYNNAISNLEWVTCGENIRHSFNVLNRKSGSSKKVMRIEDGRIFESMSEAARFCGLKNVGNIYRCIKGGRPTAGGYHWKYADVEKKL